MTPPALDQIWRCLRRDRMIDLLEEAVGEYSPSYAEGPALRLFARALSRADVPFERQFVPGRDTDAERANLIAHLGPEPAALLWVGHVDTVPLSDGADLRSEIEDDLLYGLGTADMKGGCAAIIEVLAAVVESGVELRRGLDVALVVGEEETGDGAAVMAEELSAPVVIIGEPTGLEPCVEHCGYLELALDVEGQRAHAALPDVGASAIHAMLAWLTRIMDGLSTLTEAGSAYLSIRGIRGGSKLFAVADHCEAHLDVHLIPGIDPGTIESVIEQARAAVAGDHASCRFESRREHWDAGYRAPPAGYDALADAFADAGEPWRPTLFRSHSDAPLIRATQLPPIICGPGRLEVAHRSDEHVSLTEVERAARLYAALVHQLCIA